MIPASVDLEGFSVAEWQRLDNIAATYDRELKQAYLKTVVQGYQANSLLVRNTFTDCVVRTGVSTARNYGMVFNPNSTIYRKLIDYVTDNYMSLVMDDGKAKDAVKKILPSGLSLTERRNRLDVFGLDERSAVRVERMRQEGKSEQDIQAARLDFAVKRGNLIALTEVNKVINYTLEALWIDNSQIRKASNENTWFLQEGDRASVISSLEGISSRARKQIVTRRDNRVCDYCLPMEGTTAKLGTEFDTEYGYFMSPPFHPRCRCFMIVRV